MIDPILEFLEERYGYAPPPRLYTPISEARAWWGGTWDPFHMTTEHHAGLAPRRREMYKMGMAKKICEDWATVLCNDKTRITTGDAALDRVLFGGDGGQDGVLTQGRFRGRLHAFTEQVFALGTGAAVVTPAGAEYDDGDMLVRAEGMAVDFLPADQIVPLQIENGEIVSCAFLGAPLIGMTDSGDGDFPDDAWDGSDADADAWDEDFEPDDTPPAMLLSVHCRCGTGMWSVTNYALDESYRMTALPYGIKPFFFTACPLFAILTPNSQPTDPLAAAHGMGESIFACAYDNLKGVDLAYNNFCRDLYLGGKKVFMNRELIGEDRFGNRVAPDDVAQQLFMTVGDGDLAADTMIVEHNPALRAAENCTALQAQLDYLSFKVGFGTRHYRFADDRVVTATQYAGERQEMFRNASRHYLHMEQFLRTLARIAWYIAHDLHAAALPDGTAEPVRITVDFDDSFFIDPAAERARDLSEVHAGILAPWEYRVRHYGDTEAHARTITELLHRTKENKTES